MTHTQIVVGLDMGKIIKELVLLDYDIDPGLSQSLLTRLFQDHLQANYPQAMVSVGLKEGTGFPIMVLLPKHDADFAEECFEIFDSIIDRGNWIVLAAGIIDRQ